MLKIITGCSPTALCYPNTFWQVEQHVVGMEEHVQVTGQITEHLFLRVQWKLLYCVSTCVQDANWRLVYEWTLIPVGRMQRWCHCWAFCVGPHESWPSPLISFQWIARGFSDKEHWEAEFCMLNTVLVPSYRTSAEITKCQTGWWLKEREQLVKCGEL